MQHMSMTSLSPSSITNIRFFFTAASITLNSEHSTSEKSLWILDSLLYTSTTDNATIKVTLIFFLNKRKACGNVDKSTQN